MVKEGLAELKSLPTLAKEALVTLSTYSVFDDVGVLFD